MSIISGKKILAHIFVIYFCHLFIFVIYIIFLITSDFTLTLRTIECVFVP